MALQIFQQLRIQKEKRFKDSHQDSVRSEYDLNIEYSFASLNIRNRKSLFMQNNELCIRQNTSGNETVILIQHFLL